MAEAAVAQIQKEVVAVAKPDKPAQQAGLREHLATVHKKDGAHAALEAAKKMLNPKDKFNQGVTPDRAKQAINDNIQGVTPEQQAKRDDAEVRLLSHDAYLKGGVDSLLDQDKDAFTKNVFDRVSGVPFLSENLNSLTDGEQIDFVKSLSEDPLYKAKFNELLQKRAEHKITDAMKTKKLVEMQKVDPATTPEQAVARLEQEWQESLNNIPADAATELIKQQLENADKITDKDAAKIDAETQRLAAAEGKQVSQGVMEQFRRRWEQRGVMGIDDQRKNDFDMYVKGGLKGVFDHAKIPADQQEFILNNPKVRAEYDSKFAESFVNQRLRTGKLTKDNIYSIVDDPALGVDQATRVAKLQSMMEAHKQLQEIIKSGQADGTIQRGLWDKMKGLSPHKRRNAMLGILSLLVLPVSAAAVTINHEMGR